MRPDLPVRPRQSGLCRHGGRFAQVPVDDNGTLSFAGAGEDTVATLLPGVLPAGAMDPALACLPCDSAPLCVPVIDPGPAPVQGKRLLIGIIDDAIPFVHERFRDPAGRVVFVWVQGAPHDGACSLPFGRAFDRAAIDGLCATHRVGGRLDEAAIYRAAGLADPSRPDHHAALARASHGAAVADLAGGFGPGGAAETVRLTAKHEIAVDPARVALAFVSLPPAVVRETSGTFAEPFLIAGIDAIIAAADALGPQTDVVINLSLGITAGPKDGQTPLERHMEACVAGRAAAGQGRVRFVLPAGNHRLDRTRAVVPVGMKHGHPLFWRLPPDDRTPSFLELWGPPTTGGQPPRPRFGVSLRPPGSAMTVNATGLAFAHTYDLRGDEGRLLARLTVQWHPGAGEGEGRERLTLAMPPTVSDEGGHLAPPGDWELAVTPSDAGSLGLAVDLHVQRDDSLPGFRRAGRQSRLVDPGYSAVAPGGLALNDDMAAGPYVRHDLTVNAYATGSAPLVVGGHYADGTPVEYSGLGPAKGEPGRGPDVTALSDRSPWLRGVPAAGMTSGGAASYGGTSIAAPLAARELAKAMLAAVDEAGDRAAGLDIEPPVVGDMPPRLRPRAETGPEKDPGRSAEREWRGSSLA
jgi:hypothetical protein